MRTLAIKNPIPTQSEPVAFVGGANHTFALEVHAIRADAAGTFYAHYRGDPSGEWRKHTVAAGSYTPGEFDLVRFAGTTLTGTDQLLGVRFPVE